MLPLAIALATRIFFAGCGNFAMLSVFVVLQVVHVYVFTPVAEVVAALPRSNRVIVEGVNVVKKHAKPSNAYPDGGIVDKEMPISASNVQLVDKKKEKKKTSKKSVKGAKK